MELELCLSLSSPHTPSKVFDFDLNQHCSGATGSGSDAQKSGGGRERPRLDAAFGRSEPKLRLVCWGRQPDEEEEDSEERNCSDIYEEEENNKVVGWPPIKSWMKKCHRYHLRRLHHHHDHHHHHNPYDRQRARSSSSSSSSSLTPSSSSKSMYVKVKMEGVGIARKVDIKLFNSYESLTNSLISLFPHYCDRDNTNYTFSYQGREEAHDWLPVGIVPWKIFSDKVHRIKINRIGYTKYI